MDRFKAIPSGKKAIKFTKMHGLGNDYVYILLKDNPELKLASDAELADLARNISHRHTGVGGDGMVLIAPSSVADFKMRIWNVDGSEAQMCGNASRCVGKLVFDSGLTNATDISLETLAGIKHLHLLINDGEVTSVTVNMGKPELNPELIPVNLPANAPENYPPKFFVKTSAGELCISAVSMGNPHGVCFVPEITDELVLKIGPQLEVHPAWPEKANIEFARVIDPSNIQMRVWERGSGETMACGTGACATAVAAVLNRITGRKVKVHLPGGMLQIHWDESSEEIFMTGAATTVATGTYFA